MPLPLRVRVELRSDEDRWQESAVLLYFEDAYKQCLLEHPLMRIACRICPACLSGKCFAEKLANPSSQRVAEGPMPLMGSTKLDGISTTANVLQTEAEPPIFVIVVKSLILTPQSG